MYRLSVLSPVAELRAASAAPSSQLAKRPSTLDGKVIGLLWDGFAQGDDTLKGIGEIFAGRFKGATIKFYKGGHPAPPQVLETVAAECDVVVAGFAD